MTAGTVSPARQVEQLRAAAASLSDRTDIPQALHRSMSGVMRAAAELIEAHGSPLGLPVNYALDMAGAVLGEDLGHNR